jgi:hypothetical protein
MVHFDDSDEILQPALNLEERIFKAISMNDKVAAMDKLEGLNKDFQAKVNKSMDKNKDMERN